MRQGLLEAVADVINRQCEWARAVNTRQYQHYYTRRGGHMHMTTCRCLTLEATRKHGCYSMGHRWQIPEPDLDRVYREMVTENTNDYFNLRYRGLKPTPEDVNALILKATHGIIDLNIRNERTNCHPEFYKRQTKA